MKSYPVNPMQNGTPAEVLDFLKAAADMQLSSAQSENAEIIISFLSEGIVV